MSNKRATKRALLTSILAICLCLVMLIGSTFAWFTDTASTGVNKIVAGNLDVDIVAAEPVEGKYVSLTGEGSKLAWTQKASENANPTPVGEGSPLWEPGASFLTQGFKIKNAGNLALKWKAEINKDNITNSKVGDEATPSVSLLDVIDFSMVTMNEDGTTTEVNLTAFEGEMAETNAVSPDTYYIKGTMQTTAGNDYQNLTLDGITITVYATQMASEFDSFNNTYDQDAKNPEVRTATNATSIAAAVADLANEGNKNILVSVAKDMDNTAGIKTAKGNTLTMNFNDKTVGVSYGQGSTNTTTNGMQLLQGSTVMLKNGTYKANHGEDKNHNIAILIQNYSNLTIEDCTLDMSEANDTAGNSKGTSYVISTNCGKVVIKGDTHITARTNNDGSKEYALDVMHWENDSYKDEGTSVTFDETMTGTVDGKIDVYCYRGSRVVKPVDDGGATLTIMGGTFKNSGLTLEQFKAFVPAGYTVVTNADGSYTVRK